ncbi:hypothetical protein CEXT_151971 [Caerostris extrusa]|uniref:Uncharacterized protein n=1 Tax=Caerostris extrusa TaxID=172846 RepID=A0AAV4P0P3_CAEEX|nr:hypothetical protein CEXT_151971 [Caerostris extrusa]
MFTKVLGSRRSIFTFYIVLGQTSAGANKREGRRVNVTFSKLCLFQESPPFFWNCHFTIMLSDLQLDHNYLSMSDLDPPVFMSPALLIFQVVRRPFSDNWLDSNGCYLDQNRPCAVCAIPLIEDILDTSAK